MTVVSVEGKEPLTVEYIIKGLVVYSLPVNFPSKQKHAMRCGMRKPHGLKVRLCVARLIGLDKDLD